MLSLIVRTLQENAELRRQTEAAQERSTAAERRQQAEAHKQVHVRLIMCLLQKLHWHRGSL